MLDTITPDQSIEVQPAAPRDEHTLAILDGAARLYAQDIAAKGLPALMQWMPLLIEIATKAQQARPR